MRTQSQFDHDLFRILLYRRDAADLLVRAEAKGFVLPLISVRRHSRIAREITAAIARMWNLETYCLFSLPVDSSAEAQGRYYVVEGCSSDADAPTTMQWIPVASLSATAFVDCSEFEAMEMSLATLEQYRCGQLSGTFGKPGWLREVTEWVEAQAAAVGLPLTEKFRQLNASPTFSLIRFETDGPALWFKAVGEPNVHEYSITQKLANSFSEFVPQILGTRSEWNAWLAVEAAGSPLDTTSPATVWAKAADDLARLQIASLDRRFELIDAGCKDLRPCMLGQLVVPFLDAMSELMEKQTKQTPRPLSRSELLELKTQLQDFFFENVSGIPNTIGHLDFNPGNIVVSTDRCVFLDWSEACVGHPFLTFQSLLQQVRRLHPQDSAWESALTSAFVDRWKSLVPPSAIRNALAISPLLAVFTYAACGSAWRDPARRSRPEIAACLRSLTRLIKKETDCLAERCVA